MKENVRRCATCEQLQGKFYEPPSVPPLPDFRVSDNPPFTNVGLDFIGPFITRTADKNEIAKSSFVTLHVPAHEDSILRHVKACS